jgi:hypothetical protein
VPIVDDLSRELRTQAEFLKDREPVYRRTLVLLEDAIRGEFGERLARVWAGRTFHSRYERPLLLLAALRYDALCEGPTHPLYAPLSGESTDPDAVTPDALAAALSPARARLDHALRRSVQTNETSRAVAWLWPAHLLWTAGSRRPLALVDLGTSAGLNLVADRLPAMWIDESGDPVPVEPRAPIASRLGLDLSPLDLRTPENAMWLRACVWPGDRARRDRLEQAIAVFLSTAGSPDAPALETCALPDAPARLATLPDDVVVLGVQTVVRDYLGPEERERYDAGLRTFLAARPRSALVAELEVDQASLDVAARSATLTVRWADADGGVGQLLLARTHPHPKQLFVDRQAVAAFTASWKVATMGGGATPHD